MEKLCIREIDLEDIMRCYTADADSVPVLKTPEITKDDLNILKGDLNILKGRQDVDVEAEADDNFPESAKMVYFPWNDVIGSMIEHPKKIRVLEALCPDCGEKYVELYFSSPDWTWRQLCGRAGTMTICCHCPKQVDFRLEIMN